MKTILYFYPVKSSFVISDEEILSSAYVVRGFYFNGIQKALTPFRFLHQFVFICLYIHRAHKMVSQFSGYHSFLPSLIGRLLHKPHFIILHGTECNNFPEIHYGYLNRPLLYWFSKKSMSWATKLIPVSSSLVNVDYTYKETTYVKQGFKNFYPSVSTPYEVVNNGVSPEKFTLEESQIRSPHTFITVAAGLNSSVRRLIKGIDLVIELARQTPENIYTIIGGTGFTPRDWPSNITMINYVPNERLKEYYNKNAFYLQLSISEGFVVSVCEAMLCGCIPIVSGVGASPFIVGTTGYVLTKKNVDELIMLIQKAMREYSVEQIELARKRILENFTFEDRKARLLKVIET